MKTKLAAFLLGIIAVATLAFVTTQSDGIYILNSVDQTQFKVRVAASQTNPFLEFVRDGTNVFKIAADGTVTPALAAGSSVSATFVTTATLTNKVSAANITAGTTSSAFNGAAITNLSASSMAAGTPWVTTNDSRAITNLAGDLTLEATSTFLQMNATGGGAGYKYFDFYNGGNAFSLRRKADGGGSVLDIPFTIASGKFTFGLPVELPTNSLASWPSAPTIGGAACFVNSNGTVYLLTSLPETLTWAATNKLAP